MPKADYTIMMVEDHLDYARTWIEKAFEEYDIDLVHHEDWETAFSKLKAEPDRFDALILDAKGKITRDDASESMAHIIGALTDLKEMEGRGLMIPYVINTGYIEDAIVREIQKLRDIRIFSKGRENEMFSYLVEIIKSMPVIRIRKKYEHILELFNKDVLPVEYGRKFIDLVTFAENPSWGRAYDDFFNPARKIMESIFNNLKGRKLIDERCFTNNIVNLRGCIEYLAGNTVRMGHTTFTGSSITPSHIYHSMIYVYEMTSTFSHQYMGKTDASPYALRSVAMALCEVLYWFKSLIEDLNNEKTK